MDQASLPIAVIGAGNWGTVLAHLIAQNGFEVRLYTRDPEQRDEINRRRSNKRAVAALTIHARVTATTSMEAALAGVALVVLAVPSQAMREVCAAAEPFLEPFHVVLHCTKGLELGSRKRMSEIIHEETCIKQIGVLSGPNIATELALGQPAGTVIASHYPAAVELGRKALSCPQLMVFHGEDLLGVELAGALKNVVAIAAGMAQEMGLGENAKALLVTRGLAEITRIAVTLGATPATFAGLAGMGDLLATCASAHSRNHRVGVALARGHKLADVLSEMGMVAEGVNTSRIAHELATELALAAPLIDHVYRVVHEGLSPALALDELMRVNAGRDVAAFGRASRD